ncbi:MAG: thioredoxin family protein [Planctomycetes bacterium]|nr:thioredoxin family protein [Planctomycetota bacterium]
MTTKTLFGSIIAGALFLGVGSAFAQDKPAQPAQTQPATDAKHEKKQDKNAKHSDKHAEKKAETAKVGESAPEFKLKDTDGKDVNLADYKGKVVVLEWFNPDCPFIIKHHQKNNTFNDLYTKYNAKGVVFLAINSGAEGKQGAGAERSAKAKTEYKMQYPILMDGNGKVGQMYGAKTTPHCFVIGKDGKLLYQGAIDDDKSPETPGKTNYVAKALDEILAGSTVSTPETKSYGCPVKY